MADKITNDITLLFKTKLDEKSKQEIGKNLKGLLENAAIGFDEAETKRNVEPIIQMIKRLFDKAEIAFDADKLLAMPSRKALEEMAKIEVNQLQLAFDKALAKSGGVKIDFGDIGLSELASPLKQIESELSDISKKVADTTKKSVYEIEQSLKSVSKNKSFKKIASPESIENTLIESSNDKKIHPSRAAVQLEKARDLYDKSVKEDNPWVVQYKYLLDFVSKYEKLTHQAKTKIEAERPEFKQLYDMLSPKAGAVKISLEHYVDVAKGNELSEYKNQPWGRESTLKEIRDTLKGGISVKEGSGGDNNHKDNDAPPWEDKNEDVKPKTPNTKIPTIDNADVNAAEQVKKAEEERLRIAEQRRIEQEKIAQMLKMEAGATPDTSAFNQKLFDGIEKLSNDIEAAFKTMMNGDIDEDQFDDQLAELRGEFLKQFKFDGKQRIDDYLAEKSDNMGEWNSKKIYDRLSKKLSPEDPSWPRIETPVVDTKESATAHDNLQTILTDMNKFLSSNQDKKIKDYFDLIAAGAYEMSDDVKAAVEATIGSVDSLNSINIGANNHGGLIGDKNALIMRGSWIDSNDATELQSRLGGINTPNVNLGKTQELIKTEEYLVDLQNRVSGDPISTIGEAIEDVNPNVLNATTTSIQSLVQAMRELYNAGVEVDVENLGNILYDGKSDQFGIVDMGIKNGVREFESFEEMLRAFASTVRDQVEDITNVLNNPDMAQSWSRFADMVDGEVKTYAQADVAAITTEVRVNEEKIKSYEELCAIIERLNSLRSKGSNSWTSEEASEIDAILAKIKATKGELSPDQAFGAALQWNSMFTGSLPVNTEQIAQYLGMEIPQAANVAKQAVDELNNSLEKQNSIEDTNSGEIAAEKAETDAINQQNEALKENINLKAKANTQDNNVVVDSGVESDVTKSSASSTEVKASIDTEELRSLLNSITYNVKVIQDAESADGNKVSINADELRSVLDGITYNVKLAQGESDNDSNKIAIDEGILENVLNRITYDVKIAHDDADKTSNKIAIDESALESTLNRVFGNILAPKDEGKKPEGKKEPWALEKTLNTTIKGVLDQIQTNTAKVDATSDTTGISEIKSILESINAKIVKGGVIATRGAVKQAGAQAVEPDVKRQAARSNMMKSIINDYKTMGKLAAQFASDGNLETKAMLENLKEEIRRKRSSLNITMDENANLREKYSIAFEAEKRLLEAEKQQRKINEKNKTDAKAEKKKLADAKKLAQREAMVGKAGNAVSRAENTWMTAAGMEDALPKDFDAKLDDYYHKLDALRKKQAELKNSDVISEEDKADLIYQTNNVNKLTDEISGLIAEYQKLSGSNATVIGTNTLGADAGIGAYEQQLKRAVMTATNGKAQIKGFDAATKTLTYTVKTGKNEFTQYTAAVRNLDGQLVAVQGTTKRTETFLEATKRKMKEITSYMSGMALLSRAGQELRRGIQYVRDIDLALTELKKVTDETEESYERFLDTAAKTADKVGSTIQKVVSSTADWARLGSVLAKLALAPLYSNI